MTYCAVVGCNNSNDKRRIKNPVNVVQPSFCRFPRDEKLRKLWLYRCGRPNNCTAKRLFVCLKHFKKSDYVRNLRHELLNYHPKTGRKVRFDAVPSLFLPPSVIVPDFELNETPPMKKVTIPSKQSFEPKPKIVVSTPTQILGMTYCAVVGCNNSNDKRRIENPVNYVEPSFCQFPRDEQLRKLWLYRCGRPNDCTTKRLFVCLKHFKKSDYVLNLRHELLNYHPKSTRKVRIDAVPCLFLPPSVIVPDFELNETPMNMKILTIPSKQSFEPKPKIVVSTPTQILASTLNSTIAPNPTPTLTLTSTPTPITTFNVSWQNKLSDADRLQSEFIDHVVIAYLNRCRSRAGNPNVGMPGYILKGKAQEAEVLLGARLSDPYNWVERFKPKLAEYDAKGIVLSPLPQSLNVADIISDEWPKFAKEKGLDTGEDSEETISVHEDDEMGILKPVAAINHEVASQSQAITPPPPVMEETCEDSPREILEDQDQIEKDKHGEFLKHVMMSFIRRFKATWPHAHIPDMILNAKFREAAIILQSNIKNKSIWFRKFRNRKNTSPDEFYYTEPNQSLDMADIIEVERCKFNFDKIKTPSKKGEPKKGIANEKTKLIAKEIEIFTSEETRLTAEEIVTINSEETRLTAEEIVTINSEETRLTADAEEIVTINSEDTTLTADEYEIITEPNQSLDAIIEDIIKEEPSKVIFEDSIQSILEEGSEAVEVEDTITSVLIKGRDLEKVDDSTRSILVKESEPEEVLQIINSEAKSIEVKTEQSSDLIETYEEALDCLSLLNNYALDLGDFNALTLIRQVDSYLRSDDCK